jgi:hypothetical protein
MLKGAGSAGLHWCDAVDMSGNELRRRVTVAPTAGVIAMFFGLENCPDIRARFLIENASWVINLDGSANRQKKC